MLRLTRSRLPRRLDSLFWQALLCATAVVMGCSDPAPEKRAGRPALTTSSTPGTQGAGTPVDPNEWRTVEPGTFRMGSPANEPCRNPDEDPHEVTLTRGFEMSRTEVTQAQFTARMGYNPAFRQGCDRCPVEWVTWHEAAAYCNRLSAAAQEAPCYVCRGRGPDVRCRPRPGAPQQCRGYRLPTEAEWEYAARAGTSTALPGCTLSSCMATDPGADQRAYYKVNSGGQTHPVGSKAANAWGLHDLAGSVYEWVHDWYAPHLGTAAARDPGGPATGTERVLRGGAWYFNAEHLRCANRERFAPDKRFTFVGFRCVRSREGG